MAEELRNKLYKYRLTKQRQKVFQIFKSKFREFWMLGMRQPSLSKGEQISIDVIVSLVFADNIDFCMYIKCTYMYLNNFNTNRKLMLMGPNFKT